MEQLSVETINFLKKYAEKKIVFTNGCFDILHVGHIRYLQEAKNLGDYLVVGINSDQSVKQIKGPNRPIQSEADRAEILASLACVDAVCIFTEDNPLNLIKQVSPNVLVKGGDWKPDQIIGSDFVIENGGTVESLKFHEGRSTTNIINKSKS
jgi:D-beta-D-heptose 7-phosphate kinase/D-beta-D-heptose 1-phosphate adenosyltransferase